MQPEFLVVTHMGSLIAVDTESNTLHSIPDFLNDDGRPLLACNSLLQFCIVQNNTCIPIDNLNIFAPRWTDGAARVGLQRNGRFGSAHPHGGPITFDRELQKEWEYFLLLRSFDIDAIREFASRSWFVPDADLIITPKQMMNYCSFKVGKCNFQLDENIQTLRNHSKESKNIILTRHEYCISRFISYRPLIYYVCFGEDDQFSLLNAALESLVDIGLYQGDLCIITDRNDLDEWIPRNFKGSLHILHKPAACREEFRCSRYELDSLQDINSFGPILYMDTDVCVSDRISILLKRISLSNKICAGREEYSNTVAVPPSLLTVAEAVGSKLFHRDGYDPGYKFGFNSGVMGFASISIADEAFRQVVQIIKRRMQTGEWLPYVDQPVANYVFHKLGIFDFKSLSGYIQVGTHNRLYSYIHPAEVQVLIHFWAVRSKDREKTIRNFTASRKEEVFLIKKRDIPQNIHIDYL